MCVCVRVCVCVYVYYFTLSEVLFFSDASSTSIRSLARRMIVHLKRGCNIVAKRSGTVYPSVVVPSFVSGLSELVLYYKNDSSIPFAILEMKSGVVNRKEHDRKHYGF